MINKKYSFKDFMHKKFLDVDASEFNNTEIKGSCFYQESLWNADSLSNSPKDPRVDVFPAGMTGVTFTRCNLDNCKIPSGNIIGERNSNRKIRVQNDNEDWVLNDFDNKPKEPISIKRFQEENKSINPKDIPGEKI